MSTFKMASEGVSENTTEANVVTESNDEAAASAAVLSQAEPSDPGGDCADSVVTAESGDNNVNSCTSIEAVDDINRETVDFKVIYNKQKHDLTFPLDSTVAKLKIRVQDLTGVPPAMQKIMYKGLAKEDSTLRQLKVVKGAKVMVVGSTLTDVLSVSAPNPKELQEEAKAAVSTKEPFSEQKVHKKVLEKYGKPDDVAPGIKNKKEPLPPQPVSGMYNKTGGKVRLTFKLELDQVWIGTKERTDKIPMNSIKAIVSEPIENHEEYHIMGIQLGPTEASRYWIYWVPAQYADAIKDTVLGKWQYF